MRSSAALLVVDNVDPTHPRQWCFCLFFQVRHRAGRLDVPFRWRDLSSGQTAHLLYQLREVPVGGEHQPHEEAGLCRHTEEDDHYQVWCSERAQDETELCPTLCDFSSGSVPSSEAQSTRASQTSPSSQATGSESWWSWRERLTPSLPLTSPTKQRWPSCNAILVRAATRPPAASLSCWAANFDETKNLLGFFSGLEKNFNQWDPLIDGQNENLIEGTNVTVLQSAIWTASCVAQKLAISWMFASGTWNNPLMSQQACQGQHDGAVTDKVHLYLTSGKDFPPQIKLSVDQCSVCEAWMLRTSSWTLLLFTVSITLIFFISEFARSQPRLWLRLYASLDELHYVCSVIMWWGL